MTLTSIVIPTYNGLDLLKPCIAAIREYTGAGTPYEIVVVDNGSVDGTAAYCARERVRFVRLPENRGSQQPVMPGCVRPAVMSCCCSTTMSR